MSAARPRVRSHSPHLLWPALASPRGAQVLALLHQLEHSQWWSADRLLDHQLRQLAVLLRHARETVPYYRQRLRGLELAGDTLGMDALRALPLLRRRDLQTFESGLRSEADPARFGGSTVVHTSGSTGEPVKVHKTGLDQLLWEAITLREHLWHRRDPCAQLASIRIAQQGVGQPPHGTVLPTWGPPTQDLWHTGPSALLSLRTDIATQYEWLLQRDPHYLLTFPSNLDAVLRHARGDPRRLTRLAQVRTVGETVTPQLRAAVAGQWQVPLVDLYSSNELGYVALQCPEGEHYHVMSESVLVEVLDEQDNPCSPGQTGRLVISCLHNFATPLLRYDIGDHAQVGRPCPCGRGLPTLTRILGRSRNLVTHPDGRRHWPQVGFARYREVAPVRQYQLVQVSRREIEVHLVTDRALSAHEEAALGEVVNASLGYPFRLAFRYHEGEIPRGPGHKFEEFVSKLA